MAENLKWSDEPKVVIKPAAYLAMLKHVLIYGNKYREKSVEVMGICYGKEEGGVLVQYESVPINHGTALEVEFSEKDYAAFAHADEKMGEYGWYAIGWYHSHPGLTPFFSKLDIKNHLFYQKDQSPHAYGLVFDHSLMDINDIGINLGYQAFRLDDYTLGMATDYHEIETEVEMPTELRFYHEIDEIVTAIEMKQPLVHEERDLMTNPAVFDHNDLDFNDVFHQAKKKSLEEDIGNLIPSNLSVPDSTGLKSLLVDLSLSLVTHNQGIRGPIAQLSEIINQMEEAVGPGVTRLQKTFEQDLVGIKTEWLELDATGDIPNSHESKNAAKSSIQKLLETNSNIKELLDKLNQLL